MNKWKKIVCLFCFVLLLTGCEGLPIDKVVLTTGFEKHEVFRIENSSCTVPEMMLYLTTMQKQYEKVYGTAFWDMQVDGITLSERVKENALARIAQIKTMNLMAEQYGISLDEKEENVIKDISVRYEQSLNETEKKLLQLDQALIQKMYEEYALAQKVYAYIIRDINPEVSDDEARTITVQMICFETYAQDGTGKKIPYDETRKNAVLQSADKALELIESGIPFETVHEECGEGSFQTLSFGKGELDPVIEACAFNLANNEVSSLIETQDGYYILKCINTFNKDETDANKVRIVEEKREQVFQEQYDMFVESLTRRFHKKVWKKIVLIEDPNVQTDSFFRFYEEIFGDWEL